MLNAPSPMLRVTNTHGVINVMNNSAVPALFIQFDPSKGQWILAQDDYFCLQPGETRSVKISGKGVVTVRVWNSKSLLIRLN